MTKLLTQLIILKFVDFNARWKPDVCSVRSKKKNVGRVTQETQLVSLKYKVIDEEMPKSLTKK